MKMIDFNLLKGKIVAMQSTEPEYAFNFLNSAQNPSTEWECIEDMLDSMEVYEAEPVKHGYWIKQPEKFQIYEDVINSNYLYSCSCCNASDLHSERANNDGEVKFCWRCGARMDAEPDEPWQSD